MARKQRSYNRTKNHKKMKKRHYKTIKYCKRMKWKPTKDMHQS